MLSARQISLSSINWISLSGDYFNSSRNWKPGFIQTASSTTFKHGWQGIQDIEILEDSVFLLTNECQCPIFKARNPDCCDGLNIQTNYYFYNKNNDYSNTALNNDISGKIFSSCYYGGNQYGLTFPINHYETSSVSLNLIELDNAIDVIPVSTFSLKKEFNKILKIHSDLGFSTKDDRLEKVLKFNETTLLEIPSSKYIDFIQLNKIVNGFYGDAPCNSDLIITKTVNNLVETFWLSGYNDLRTWMKREQINANEFNDYPQSLLNGVYNKEIRYDRFGNERNDSYLETFDSSLFVYLSAWNTQLINSKNNYDLKDVGVINESYNNSELELDGNRYAYISNNILNSLVTNDFTINLDYKMDRNHLNFGQIFGNYYKQGFGIFLNSGMDNSNVTIIGKNGIVYSLNRSGILTYLKDFKKATEYSSFDMRYIVNDLDGAKWIYDANNQVIFKYETDDIISTVIKLEDSAVLSTNKPLYVDGNNQLWLMDTFNKKFICYSEKGWLKSSAAYSGGDYSNFYFRLDASAPTPTNSTFSEWDASGNLYEFIGLNLYKNGKVFRHFGKSIHDLVIDECGNVLIIVDMLLIKLNTDGEVIFKKIIIDSIKEETLSRLNIIKDTDGKENYVIIFNDNKVLLKLDASGTVLQRIDLYDVLKTSNQCEDIDLFTRGDFTGHYVHKLANVDLVKKRFSSFEHPYLNLKCKFNTNCEEYNLINFNVNLEDFFNYVNISVVLNNRNGTISLYLNADRKLEYNFGSYNIDLYKKYSENVSPFIFGGNSGKIGSLNQEWNLKDNYLKGSIKNFRWYDRALDYYPIRSLFLKSRNEWQNLIIDLNLNTDGSDHKTTSYVDKVDGFFKASFPGAYSNYFNIRVNNGDGITDVNKQIVEKELIKIVDFSKPDHTFLNKIVWD